MGRLGDYWQAACVSLSSVIDIDAGSTGALGNGLASKLCAVKLLFSHEH